MTRKEEIKILLSECRLTQKELSKKMDVSDREIRRLLSEISEVQKTEERPARYYIINKEECINEMNTTKKGMTVDFTNIHIPTKYLSGNEYVFTVTDV
jgi:transcriptional antiterminator